jgi:hypothetical protein
MIEIQNGRFDVTSYSEQREWKSGMHMALGRTMSKQDE